MKTLIYHQIGYTPKEPMFAIVVGPAEAFRQWAADNNIRLPGSVRHINEGRDVDGLTRPPPYYKVVILPGANPTALRFLERRGILKEHPVL